MLVHLAANRADVTVLELVGELGVHRPWDWNAWEPVCRPPCDARLSSDDGLGLSIGEREPIELLERPRLVPGGTVDLRYDDRRTLRNVARVLFLAGLTAAVSMIAVGTPGDRQPWHAENVALVSGGFAAMFGSLWVLMGPTSQPDAAHASP